MNDAMKKAVETLIQMAAASSKPDDAMKFAQAACNVANAICTIKHAECNLSGGAV